MQESLVRKLRDFITDAQIGLAGILQAEGQKSKALPLAREARDIYEQLRHRNLPKATEMVELLERMEIS